MKPVIYSGADSIKQLDQFHHEVIYLVCDPYLKETEKFREILHLLKDNQVTIFSDIVPDPPIEIIVRGTRELLEKKPSVLITIGGGSAIDAGKAMFYFYEKIAKDKIKTFIAIPTTSGTGSEVTSAAVITDPVQKVKYPIFDEKIIPNIAILDTELVLTSPSTVTAYSGLDVLTHALEALVAENKNNYTTALAERSIEIVFHSLITCVKEGQNIKARTEMHEASCLAGLAFDLAGLGVCHAIAHQVGGHFKVPHGLANALLLPHVIEANSQNKEAAERYANISKKLGLCSRESSNSLAITRLQKKVQKLVINCDCSLNLKDYGVSEKEAYEAASKIARNAINDITYKKNPIKFTEKEIEEIYKNIVE